MIDTEAFVNVTNRDLASVGYGYSDSRRHVDFAPGQTRSIKIQDLIDLTYEPGGMEILKNYLTIEDRDAANFILNGVEPEYNYTEEDIKRIMTEGTLPEFQDMLDYAPNRVLEQVKALAIALPLNDIQKREAILNQIGFNVSNYLNLKKAVEQDDGDAFEIKEIGKQRRASVPKTTASGRRTAVPNKTE